MSTFMQNTYDNTRLKVLEWEIKSVEDRISSFEKNLATIQQQKFSMQNELNESQSLLSSLEVEYVSKKLEREKIQTEIDEFILEIEQKEKAAAEISEKMRGVNQPNFLKNNQLLELSQQITSLKGSIEILAQRIRIYNIIIAGNPPEPKYRIDGEVCINGIPNCKNHPPKQVLINEDEINEYRKSVEDAKKQNAQLIVQQNEMAASLNGLEQEYAKLQAEIELQRNGYEQYKTQLDQLDALINQNKGLLEKKKIVLQNLLAEENQLHIQLGNTRNKVYNLAGDISKLEYEIKDIEHNLEEAKLELLQLNDKLEAVKDQIASQKKQQMLQKLDNDLNNQNKNDGSTTETPHESMAAKLKRLAVEELKKEAEKTQLYQDLRKLPP